MLADKLLDRLGVQSLERIVILGADGFHFRSQSSTTSMEATDRQNDRSGLRAVEAALHGALFERSRIWLFLFWFLLILLLQHKALFRPPIWDSAMGVFPPAIYLYESGFDVESLLHQDNWFRGGPNVHVFCLLTWAIAIVMKITGSAPATFFTMHVLMFAGMAWALTLFCRLLERWEFGRWTAFFAGMFMLLMPIVLVQTGRIYMELPVLILAVMAVDQWSHGRWKSAIAILAVALFFKLTAVAIGLAMLAALLMNSQRWSRRSLITGSLVVGAMIFRIVLPRMVAYGLAVSSSEGPSGWGGSAGGLLTNARFALSNVPDLNLLVVLSSFAALAMLLSFLMKAGRAETASADGVDPGQLICILLPLVFVCGSLAMILRGSLFLPRYLIPMIPFALVTVLLAARAMKSHRFAAWALMVCCLFFLLNRNGRFYRTETHSFSVVERSAAANAFHDLQIRCIEMLEEKPDGLPAYVSKEIDYMISSPMMGYVQRRIPLTFPIHVDEYVNMRLADFPDEFLLLRSNRFHGGKRLEELAGQASGDPAYLVEQERLESGDFVATVYQVRRIAH